MPPRSPRNLALATFAITSIALFMVSLDNLVVTTALPVIKQSLGATLSQLEWMVNAYTLTFAVLLLTGAALGDRFGRKRVFTAGVALFTAGSAFAALAPSGDMLVLARAIQGVGAAVVTPLTLTILSSAVPKERRGLALGLWGAIAGLAIALGPLVGGAIVQGLSWQWIFWLNVPLGIVLVPLAAWQLQETHGPDASIDLPGLGLASTGLFALVWALIHGNEQGWTSTGIVAAFAAAALLLVTFVAWEARTSNPMLPLRFFRSRAFAAANTVSLLMSFGMFGSIFLLAQFFQIVQGYSPFEAGLRTLPWTAMPIVVAPIAGVLSDRVGSRPLLVIGMALMAVGLGWIAAIATPTVEYLRMVPAFVLAGTGMSMFFAPTANLVLTLTRRAGRRARTTRSARSAACSGSRCSRRCSRPTGRMSLRRHSWTAWFRRSGWAPRPWPWRRWSRWRSRAGGSWPGSISPRRRPCPSFASPGRSRSASARTTDPAPRSIHL